MSKRMWLMVIIVISFLVPCAALASAGPGSDGPVVHENPAGLTTQQPFDVNGKLMFQLEQMFGSLDNVALRINMSDYNASRLSMRDFEQYYRFFQDYLGRANVSGSDYQRILGQADLTANDLRAMINNSEAFNASMASFDRYWAQGDTVNATIQAVELQKYFGTMNRSSQELTASASAIGRLLRNTSVDTNRLDRGVDMLNVYMDRVEALNQLPKSILGDTNLTLYASLTNVSTGDMVMFYARLSSDNTTIGGGLISLWVDGEPVANATTGADGTCAIYHVIRGGTFARTVNVIAYYDPRGADYTPAVSNNVPLQRRTVTPVLTLDLAPKTASYGDTVHMQGRLVADGGYPVPDHLVSISFPGSPACFARTFENGSYYCDMYITPEVRSGRFEVLATYDAGNMPGDALTGAKSPGVMLNVNQAATSTTLDRPASILHGGENAWFTGSLESAGSRPVGGEEVSIYAGNVRLGSNYTDDNGRYDFSIVIPCNLTAGTSQVYAAYQPPAGMSLTGSSSSEYRVAFEAAPPTIGVYGAPLIAFQGDRLDLIVNVTAKGTAVDRYYLLVNLSDRMMGKGWTDASGNFYVANQINGSAGLQTIKVYTAASGLLEAAAVDTVTVLIMPFDTATSLAILAIIIAVLGLVIARVTRAKRVISRLWPARKTALPRPTITVTPLPGTPEGPATRPRVTRFEDEVVRIESIIASGADYREVITEIYLAARRITGNRGFAIPESATHREYYRKLIAQEPVLNVCAGTITRHYESAVFGDKPLSEKDIVGSLYSLKEINTFTAGEIAEGSASTGGGT